MLAGYEQAELVASRVAASKMGFFKRTNPDARYSGEDEEHDDRGNVIQEADPGSMTELPFGVEFQAWDPEHPGGNFKPFVKAVLRGASCARGIVESNNTAGIVGITADIHVSGWANGYARCFIISRRANVGGP